MFLKLEAIIKLFLHEDSFKRI